MEIRKLLSKEVDEAIALVWLVYMKYVASDYSDQGNKTFRAFIQNQEQVSHLQMYGAFIEDEMVGVIALREETHISLFFVKEDYQGQKIGRKLFEYVKSLHENERLTVNASPYAVPIYHKLGFRELSPQEEKDGIIFTHMAYENNK